MTFAIVIAVCGLVFLGFCAWLERAYNRTATRCCDHLCTSDRRPIPGQRKAGEQ
jgi:hypothetical protein